MSASQDKTLRLWNPHTGSHIKTYTGPHNQEVNDVVITEDNSKFLSCGGDKQFFQWDVTTGQVIRKFIGHDRKINALAFGPKQDLAISASHDKSVRIWDLRARARGSVQSLTDATDSVLCVTVAGDEITTGSTDGGLRRYDVRKGQLIADQLLQPIGSVSFSTDQECMLVSTLDSSVRLMERETGSILTTYRGHSNKSFKVQSVLDPTDTWVVAGSEDGRIRVWDLAEAKVVSTLDGHSGPVLCVRFFEDTMVTAAGDGEIKVWKTEHLPDALPEPEALKPMSAGLPASFGKRPRLAGSEPPGGPAVGSSAVAAARASFAARASAPSAAAAAAASADARRGRGASPELAGEDVEADTIADGSIAEPPRKKKGDRGRKSKRRSADELAS